MHSSTPQPHFELKQIFAPNSKFTVTKKYDFGYRFLITTLVDA